MGKSIFANIVFLFIVLLILTTQKNLEAQTYRIMPLGNSITRGSMCLNGDIYSCTDIIDANAIGYRYILYNLLISAGYDIDFVGSENYGGSMMTDTDNAAFPGSRDNHIADIMETGTSSFTGMVTSGPYLESYPADIILLHIGTNDVQVNDYTVSDVEQILDAIDNYEISSGNPVMVFLARIISRQGKPCNMDAGIVQFNSNLDAMAALRIASGDKLIIVDMECTTGIDYYADMVDQVHPNQTGYNKMGQAWFNAIDAYLNPVPAAPSGLNFDNITTSSIRLNWIDNSDNEDGFEIERSESLSGSFDLIHITDPNVTSYTDTGLDEGRDYFYRVKAVNTGGTSSYVSGSATTLVSLPAAPSELNFDNITVNSIRLNWTDNSNNEDGFEIRRSESFSGSFDLIHITDPNVTSYTDTGLDEGRDYFYHIIAVNVAGTSSYVSGSATTLVSLPAAPNGLNFDSITTNSIRLNWTDNSDNEDGFKIWRSESITGTFTEVFVTEADITTYTDNGLTDDTEYFYQLNAVNAAGVSSYASGSAKTLKSLPAEPSGLNFDSITTNSIRLNWTDNSDNEDGFKIWRSESLMGTYTEIFITEADITTYTDNGLTDDKEYFYLLNAVNAKGASSYISGNAKTLKSLPAAPSGLNFDSITTSSIRLNWNDNSDNEDGFEIRRSESITDDYDIIHTTLTNVVTYTDSGLEAGTEYFYRVNAVNATGSSTYISNNATTLMHGDTNILIAFYPNPNNGKIAVTLKKRDENIKVGYLRLSDFSGRVLFHREIDLSDGMLEKILEIQLPTSFKNGFYLLSLIEGEVIVTEKLILLR